MSDDQHLDRVFLTADRQIILPSGRMTDDLRDVDEPCILVMIEDGTGREVEIPIDQASCDETMASLRKEYLPHTCKEWCEPPQHADLVLFDPEATDRDIRMFLYRDARWLGRTVDRIVEPDGYKPPREVPRVVFFHGGEL